VCVLGCVLAHGVSAGSCKILVEEVNQQQYVYDVSELGEVTVKTRTNSYTIDLCKPLSGECGTESAVCRGPPIVGNARNATDSDYTSLGKFSTRSVVPYGYEPAQPGIGFVALFGQGDACEDSDVFTSGVIVICDPNEKALVSVTQEESCYYEFSISTKYGCGVVATSSALNSSEGGSDAGEVAALVILLILLVSVVLYFAVGAIYQKKTQDPATLRDYVIHNQFWCSLPSLVVDGVKFIFHGCRKGDYVSV